MTVRLLVATRNRGKVRELSRMLDGASDLLLLSVDDVPGAPEVVEDGATFEANARKKAREVARATGLMTLADDSGLEVDALDGAPGVYSARYAGLGEGTDPRARDAANNATLLAALAATPDAERGARFRCVLALADPKGPLGDDEHVEHGTSEGRIARAARGQSGFGYDPLFIPQGEGRTFGELGAEVKDARSHRAVAARAMTAFLRTYLPGRRGPSAAGT